MLWRVDTSMTLALDVADAWLGPTDYLTALWPCQSTSLSFGYVGLSLMKIQHNGSGTMPSASRSRKPMLLRVDSLPVLWTFRDCSPQSYIPSSKLF